MKTVWLRAACALFLGLAPAGLVWPASAQGPGSAPPTGAAEPRPAAIQSASEDAAAPAQPPAAAQSEASAAPSAAAAASDVAQPASVAVQMRHDLSPWLMFLSADVPVKAVMVCLGFASLLTWTIFFAKTVQLWRARRRLRGALGRIAPTRTLAEAQLILAVGDCVLAAFLSAAIQEIKLSGPGARADGVKERAASRFAEIARAEARAMRQDMAVLATVGATAPFVGLFGTVWGIMNSFIGISKAQTTNLAVVAPGIAEALLATAIGLVAAIPAVMIYNYFARATKSYQELIGRGSGAVGRLLSRELDRISDRPVTQAAE